jgi:hypothetical protein
LKTQLHRQLLGHKFQNEMLEKLISAFWEWGMEELKQK